MHPAPYAMDVRHSRGRRYPETAHSYRNDYARDRDRVVHSRAFRRLEAKTQVFTTRFSDHFRNRLTHTLEVTQIARTVAGALGLNTDLAEALALVHDAGHPPFGHAGEKQLDKRMRAAAGNLEFEEAARLRDEIRRLQATELAIADDPYARQNAVEASVAEYRQSGAPESKKVPRKPRRGMPGTRATRGKSKSARAPRRFR